MLKLTVEDVVAIYRIKLYYLLQISAKSYLEACLSEKERMYGTSAEVARWFNVSPRTVRDIWTHRTHLLITARVTAEWDDPFHADWPHWS